MTAVDGRPVWTTQGGPGITVDHVRQVVVIHVTPPSLVRAPAAHEFRWVGADVDLFPGRHRVSVAMLNDREHKLCTVDVDVEPHHTDDLKKGERDVPVLQDIATGASSSGHCAPDDRQHIASIMTPPSGLAVLFNGWSPWVKFGARTIRTNQSMGSPGTHREITIAIKPIEMRTTADQMKAPIAAKLRKALWSRFGLTPMPIGTHMPPSMATIAPPTRKMTLGLISLCPFPSFAR